MGDVYRQQQRYWQDRLNGSKATLPLPTDRPRPPVQTYVGSVERFRLDPQTVQAVEALGQEQSATLFMTLLTCFAMTLAEWTREQDIVLASPVAGRQHKDLTGMIGLMVNLLPLRVELGGNPVFRDLLTAVREACLEAQQHQDVTFDHILDVAEAEHNPGRSPYSQVVFNVQHAPDSQFEEEGLRFSPLAYETDTSNTDLALVMDRDRNGGMEGVIAFNTDLFDRETMQQLISRYQAVLNAVVIQADGRLSAICRAGGLDAEPFLDSQKKADPSGYYREHSNLTEHELVLWAGQQLDAQNPVYNSTITYRMPEPIDIGAFRRAFQALVDRRDSLRTVIRMEKDVPQRHVIDHLEYNVIYQDFSKENEPDAAATAWIERQSKTAFALDQVLFRCALLKVSDDDFIWYMSQHHIITDGWSQVLAYQDMSDYYRQALSGDIALRDVPQFADYADHEGAYMSSARYTKDAAYWQAILSREREPLSFYGRVPAKSGTDMRRVSRRLGEDLSGKIHAFVAERQTDRNTAEAIGFNLFLAVFAVYLWRVSGRMSFPVGIPLHNRRQKEMKDVMGLIMRVVPLSVELQPEQTLAGLMDTLKRCTLKAMQHGQYLINNNHKDPVYDVLLNYHTWRGANFHTRPLAVEWRHPMQAFESLALNVHDMERAFEGIRSNIQIDFDFHCDVFDGEQGEQAIAHFRQLLETCIDHPDQPLSELSLMSEEEERRLLVEWNDTAMELPEATIHKLIEQQAELNPEGEALRFEGESLTYGQLNVRANQLAGWLREQGVARDQLVGICMERSFEMVIGLLAIVKAGGAYVPVDPSYPADRIAFMLEDSDVSLLLTQGHLASTLPDHRARVFCVDTEGDTLTSYSSGNPCADIKPDDLAYMIYTSGSTGKPKGAMNHHRAILNRLVWMQHEYRLDGDDKILQKTPFSFDVSVWEFFWPLMYGATLVIARPEGHKDSAYLRDLIRTEGITTLHFVPSMLQLFLEESELEQLTSLKRVICSGEALSTEVQAKFFKRCSFAGLHNLYGPTEAAIDVTYYPCRPDDDRHTVPIGRPVANTQIYILDKQLKPVPAGVPGELHIGGVQLARGYHNRPELTAEKFIPDPFLEDPQARLYKTGDLARYLPDGQIEFLGRLDHQVKIRGFRIELGEIEAALLRYAGIKECVVVARKDATGADSLAAYLVTDGAQPGVEDIRAFLMESLPDYMVPAVMMFIDEMPLSPNGKLDRKALPEPQVSRVGLRKEYTAPRNELEERLAAIFRELLDVDRVGVHDNFFELGGHSLQAIRLISRIRADLQTELPLRIFFESSDVAQLALRIEEAREQQSQRPRFTLEPVSRDQRLPLAFTQKRLWILDQLDPDNSAYNMPTAIGIKGPFRPELFERIFNAIIERHEILRTSFTEENGQPYITIAPRLTIQLPVSDLREVAAEKRRDEAWRIATEEASQPFDLTRGPLVRARALRLEKDEHVPHIHDAPHHHQRLVYCGVCRRDSTAIYSLLQ